MIRNLLMDLDDTILDFGKEEEKALELMLEEIGVSPTRELAHLYSRINLSWWKRLELGEVTRRQVKVGRFEEFFEEISVKYPAEEADKRYRYHLERHPVYRERAQETLRRLQGRVRLYLVTNGTLTTQKSRIGLSGIGAYFDGMFISEEIGANKPSEKFFEIVFSNIPDFCREETMIIGDSLTSDIAGGVRAGIGTVWYNWKKSARNGEICPDYEIETLEELFPILETE